MGNRGVKGFFSLGLNWARPRDCRGDGAWSSLLVELPPFSAPPVESSRSIALPPRLALDGYILSSYLNRENFGQLSSHPGEYLKRDYSIATYQTQQELQITAILISLGPHFQTPAHHGCEAVSSCPQQSAGTTILSSCDSNPTRNTSALVSGPSSPSTLHANDSHWGSLGAPLRQWPTSPSRRHSPHGHEWWEREASSGTIRRRLD